MLLPLVLGAALALRPPSSTKPTSTRRTAVSCAAAALLLRHPAVAFADDVIACGTVSIQPGVEAIDSPAAALYITVRVVPANNVGLYVNAGKVPPLAAARFAAPTFPYSFSLMLDSLTPEFSSVPRAEWEGQDLIVSVRLDTDGVAATRDPGDLVGRGMLLKAGNADQKFWTPAVVELQGRGLTGRLLTGGR